MQVDPIKPTLKAPVSMSLKLKYDKLLSNVAFTFNLRRFNTAFDHTYAYARFAEEAHRRFGAV